MIVALITTSGMYPNGVNAIMMIMAVNKRVSTSSFVFVLRIASPPLWSKPLWVSSVFVTFTVRCDRKLANAKLYGHWILIKSNPRLFIIALCKCCVKRFSLFF